jgi:SEC-C motif
MKNRRNEPCHCGSGKKFKRCCGVQPQVSVARPMIAGPNAGVIPSFYQPFAAHGISPDVVEAMERASRQ